MIRIEQIEITEFRGIRQLTLNLGKKSFGIAGPNGTGKSGVVDAIEFVLTGGITRLGRAGTGEISVNAHAPHVDSAKSPEKAVVRLTAQVPNLSKPLVIERSVKSASAPKLTPDNAQTRAILAQLETHPEFALSRREIIKYILTPAGERSKDVQILLRLDELEKVRSSLQRIANDMRREHARAEVEDARCRQDFLQHIGIQAAKKSDLLTAVNARRSVLKLEPLTDLSAETSMKDGVTAGSSPTVKPRLSKANVTAELALYQGYAEALESNSLKGARDKVAALLAQLTVDSAILKGFRQKVLVEQGIELIDDEACPLCDTAWNLDSLKAHLQEKVAKATAASAILHDIASAIDPINASLENAASAAQTLVRTCGGAEPKIDSKALADFASECGAARATLTRLEADPGSIPDVLTVLDWLTNPVAPTATAVVAAVKTHVEGLPEPSAEEAAKEYLIVAQEKYERCRVAKEDMENLAARSEIAAKVFECYGKVSTAVLEGIYDSVQKNFTSYYRYITETTRKNSMER